MQVISKRAEVIPELPPIGMGVGLALSLVYQIWKTRIFELDELSTFYPVWKCLVSHGSSKVIFSYKSKENHRRSSIPESILPFKTFGIL